MFRKTHPVVHTQTTILSLLERGGKRAKKKVVIAVARKLGILLHRLWVTGEMYEPLRSQSTAAAEENGSLNELNQTAEFG